MRSIKIAAAGFALLSLGGLTAAADLPSGETLASYIQNSVEHYEAGRYDLSLQAAMAAHGEIERNSAIVYNNICAAHNRMGNYAEGILACNKALEIFPGYALASRNLEWGYVRQMEQSPSVGGYLNLSVVRYRLGAFDGSIEACEAALRLEPGSALAHNNLCSAYAMKEEWELAIAECNKALAIDPGFERAANNLEWANSRTTPTAP